MTTARADEGMWLLNAPPRDLLKEKYGFDMTDAWLQRAQLANIRFNSGGSGSFVSPDGLIVTNHHIGADSLAKLSPPDRDYLRDGFLARKRQEELKCPDLELNVLQSIEDVTERVNGAVKEGMSAADAGAARRSMMAAIEKESTEKTGLRSDVVTLYQGGKYHLYRYKKYTDVRLVMAPEQGIAFFGGDVDNFEYPRFNLDVCFFRAYENDQPAKVQNYLKWSPTGPSEGDLVFVTGHPGTTNRLETLAKLEHRRDYTLPYTLARLRMLEAILEQFSARTPAYRKMASEDLHRVANARKAFTGMYQGLLDPAILARKAAEEKNLRDRVAGDAALKTKVGDAWDQVAKAQQKLREIEKLYYLLERGDALDSRLFAIARHLVRMAAETPRENGLRLREYRDSALESLKLQLFSPAPIHLDLERVRLTAGLSWLAENLGGEHPLVVQVLAGKSPADRAEELLAGTKLADPAVRQALAKEGQAGIDASKDAMILFAKLVDGEARSVRRSFENEVEEPERQGNGRIAEARFAILGTGVAPDATFTLRLAFGVVKGYEVEGTKLPFHTTFGGAFERAEAQQNREPFDLPARWREGREKLDLSTPFNFVSTADTIGGNSGSPVLNRAGELVGINFDRNRHGLVRNFVYTDVQARHISVHSKAVLEALRKLYAAEDLLQELLAK